MDKINRIKANLSLEQKKELYSILVDEVTLSRSRTVLVLGLGSPYFSNRIKEEHSDMDVYYIEDRELMFFGSRNSENTYYISMKDTQSIMGLLKEINIKFDLIIMNPPYRRNLHIKILCECLKYLSNEDSLLINLSPTRWLEDITSRYKRNSDFFKFNYVLKYCKEINVIDAIEAGKLFSNDITENLGIYTFTSVIGSYSPVGSLIDKETVAIFDKVYTRTNETLNGSLESVCETDKVDGWRWQTSDIQPITAQGGKVGSYGWYRRFCVYNHLRSTLYFNGKKDGKDWTEFNSGIRKEKNSPIPLSIKLGDTEKDEYKALNFEDSLKTTFYEYMVLTTKSDQHTPFRFLPFMGTCLNPRTKLIGYESDWANEDFYTYFNLTEEEIHFIENKMRQYKTIK